MTLTRLESGDSVIRLLAGTKMPMRILYVDETRIHCVIENCPRVVALQKGLVWTFDRTTGAEIDDDLGWGPAYGRTGSFLVEG